MREENRRRSAETKRRSVETRRRSARWIVAVTMVGAAAMMGVPAVFGFDYCDTGFYLTFYENIFTAPRDVEYNFMYYLSGLVGGAWMRVFPGSGIIGIRILGMLMNLLAIAILFYLYRGRPGVKATAVGAMTVVMAYLGMPMAFYNDILTATMLVAGVAMLVTGLFGFRLDAPPSKCTGGCLICLGGIVLGMNVFSRTPNVLDVGLAALIPIYCRIYGHGRAWVRPTLIFLGGFMAGMGAIVLLMAGLGHLDIYLDNLKDLFTASASQPGEGSTHGLRDLIRAQAGAYILIFKASLKYGFLFAAAVGALWIRWRWVRWAIWTAAGVGACWFMARIEPVVTVAAATLPVLVWNIARSRSRQMRFYSWCALMVAVIFPLGSDGAMINNGSIVYWLGAPLAAGRLGTLRLPPRRSTEQGHGTGILIPFVIFWVVMGVRTVREGVYFDGAPLWRMTARVETARDNGFLTTPERAERVREMTEAVERHAKRGERVMMFGSMPIMNYLTETRPALGCSWPELLSEGMLERKLREAEDVKMVMIQKFGTIGGAYEDRFEENAFHTERKDRILMEYLYRKGFRKIEEGKEYEIWVGTDEGARDGILHRRINKNCAESRRTISFSAQSKRTKRKDRSGAGARDGEAGKPPIHSLRPNA